MLGSRRWYVAAVFLAAARLALLAGTAAAAAPTLVAVPRPGVSMLEPAVAAELDAAHRALESANAAGDRRTRAAAWGALGRRYAAYELWDAARACFANAHILAPDAPAWAYLEGFTQQQRGQLGPAADALYAASRLAPGNAATWLRLGEVELARGEAEAARKAFERAAPAGAAAAFGLARALAALGEDRLAVRAFEHTLALEPGASVVHLPLAMAYRRQGRTEDARRQLALRGNRRPHSHDPLVEDLASGAAGAALAKFIGDQAVLAGRLKDAAAAYRRAVEVDPERFAYRKSLGLTLAQLGEPAQARRELQVAERLLTQVAALQRPHEAVEVLYALAGLAANGGDDATARDAFRRVLAIDPCHADSLLGLGNIAGRAGDLEAALVAFDRALACDPDHAAARLQQATTRMDLGRFQDAVDDLERLLARDPSNPVSRRLLAIARSRAGGAGGG